LREWADKMDFESLQEFAKHAPKVKTILQQTNDEVPSEASKDMQKWKEEQSKSRIIK